TPRFCAVPVARNPNSNFTGLLLHVAAAFRSFTLISGKVDLTRYVKFVEASFWAEAWRTPSAGQRIAASALRFPPAPAQLKQRRVTCHGSGKPVWRTETSQGSVNWSKGWR